MATEDAQKCRSRPRSRFRTSINGTGFDVSLSIEQGWWLDRRTELQLREPLEAIQRLLEESRPVDDDG
jgi:hypothetical protein